MVAVDMFAAIQQAVTGAQTELILFILAIVTHQVVFGYFAIPRSTSKACKTSSPKGNVSKKLKPLARAREETRAENGTKQADDLAHEASLIKAAASNGSLDEALKVFKSFPKQHTAHYNALLDACVTKKDLGFARRVITNAVAAKVADTITFNSFIKCFTRAGDVQGAREAIREMRSVGLKPNCATFNELLESTAAQNIESSWRIVREMKAAAVKPNAITCSILLKCVQANSNNSHLEEVLALMQDIDDKVDEVLLSSVIEACIRAARMDLLESTLRQQRSADRVQIQSSHAYGSLIRAYGVLKDIGQVWATWQELKTRRVELTSVTFGCMVEAVATNTGPEDAYELIRETSGNPKTQSLLNSIVYGSILKGFSHQKQFDKVWAIYKEMKNTEIALTITTYNTLVDACARCAELAHIPDIMSDMAASNIQPNIITYCSIIKCYCQENRIDRALEVMEQMRKSSALKPDEHTYNTVINGCARQGLYDKGVALLEEMCNAGVKPSNFTLSVLVKLASRSRRLDSAFHICEELSQKYDLRLNVHVYNNLIQACISHRKGLQSAFKVVERMLSEKVRLDTRTYTLLLQACADAGEAQDVAGLIRAAAGLDGVHPQLADVPRSFLQPHGGLPSQLLSDMVQVIATRCNNVALAKQLVQDLRRSPSCKLDPTLTMQFLQK